MKDADFFGKQDPFIKFTHFGREHRTKTIDEGGKHAIFNEDFILSNIPDVLNSQEALIFNSFDEDGPGTFDFIGGTQGIKYQDLVSSTDEKTLNLDLLDKKGGKCGNIIIKI